MDGASVFTGIVDTHWNLHQPPFREYPPQMTMEPREKPNHHRGRKKQRSGNVTPEDPRYDTEGVPFQYDQGGNHAASVAPATVTTCSGNSRRSGGQYHNGITTTTTRGAQRRSRSGRRGNVCASSAASSFAHPVHAAPMAPPNGAMWQQPFQVAAVPAFHVPQPGIHPVPFPTIGQFAWTPMQAMPQTGTMPAAMFEQQMFAPDSMQLIGDFNGNNFYTTSNSRPQERNRETRQRQAAQVDAPQVQACHRPKQRYRQAAQVQVPQQVPLEEPPRVEEIYSDDDPVCVAPHTPEVATTAEIEGSNEATKSPLSDNDEIIHFDWERDPRLRHAAKHTTYQLKRQLGEGTFGRVLLATVHREYTDHTAFPDTEVAIKVVRDVPRYMENAKVEANILEQILNADKKGISRCVRLLDTFLHRKKFYCIVTEALGESLYEFLKANEFMGYYLEDIQDIATQSLDALEFLKSMQLSHTDLKPENILFASPETYICKAPEGRRQTGMRKHYRRPQKADIKLVDFGNATFRSDTHSSIINTRQYRSPEVILGSEWDESGDIWCLGCILVELYNGNLLFSVHSNFEQLVHMERIVGPFPNIVVEKALPENREKYFSYDRRRYHVKTHEFLASATEKEKSAFEKAQSVEKKMKKRTHLVFARFCEKMIVMDKKERQTPTQLKTQPFLYNIFSDEDSS